MNSLLASTKNTDTAMGALTEIPCTSDEFTEAESELAPLLAAWDRAHPAVADPEWRHLLDEITRPRTTQAFHRLAVAAGS
ncbi:hypothetical protein [Streptomyces sp. 2A115]|uniref:hypothetical protein n=1 Tax=Streptomyces sp. 2A115 TaxID=3457439 RepID=UPI003FD4F643